MNAPRTSPAAPRLLLNAEPFGFGPSAAIAAFFPRLRPHFAKIGYLGKRHTLDLQTPLPYDEVHDVSAEERGKRSEWLTPIFRQYDILFTAMDHKVAGEAARAGLKVFYYDALAWYWPEIPEAVRNCDLYLAQDFFGVAERLKSRFSGHAAAHAVPPIVSSPPRDRKGSRVLVNLGGLQHPHWSPEDVVRYARSVLAALRRALPAGEEPVVAASRLVADELRGEGVRFYPRQEMEGLLARARIAFMTPGLGNIYDAAACGLPTIWLPPVNDSQGRQLRLIEGQGLSDGSLDWSALDPAAALDYGLEQTAVLAGIARLTSRLAAEPALQDRLAETAALRYREVAGKSGCAGAALLEKFGRDGVERVTELVIDRARQLLRSSEALHG